MTQTYIWVTLLIICGVHFCAYIQRTSTDPINACIRRSPQLFHWWFAEHLVCQRYIDWECSVCCSLINAPVWVIVRVSAFSIKCANSEIFHWCDSIEYICDRCSVTASGTSWNSSITTKLKIPNTVSNMVAEQLNFNLALGAQCSKINEAVVVRRQLHTENSPLLYQMKVKGATYMLILWRLLCHVVVLQ